MTTEIGTWYWHIHHEILAEPLTEPLENRLSYIRTKKPEAERATRLALIHPVIWPEGSEAYAACTKAYAARTKADAARTKADAARTKAYAAWAKADAARTKAYAACTKADAARTKAYAACTKAYAACTTADAARTKADAALLPHLEVIHATSCPGLFGVGTCPWNGKTIFPR